MNVNAMRWIDRWVGIPLCFLATLAYFPFSRLAAKKTPGNILFIELSEMGSAILADPAMRKAKEHTGGALFFAIFRRNAGSLGFLKTVPEDNIFTLRDDGMGVLLIDTLRFLAWTRKRRIDTVIDLELFSRFTALLTGLSGAVNRVGFYRFHNEGLYRGELLTHKVAYNPHMHIARNFVAMINALLSAKPETPYSKTVVEDSEICIQKPPIDTADQERMYGAIQAVCAGFDRTRHRLVLLNPNASEMLPQRRWPHANFARLASMALTRWEDIIILVTGAPAERGEAENLVHMTGGDPRLVNFAGKCTLHQLPALYGIAQLMVTNDSGPGHFSSVTDMPAIVLFGPETPALYGSLGNSEAVYAGLACSPCVSAANHRKTACRDPVCMQAITPEQVFERMAQYL